MMAAFSEFHDQGTFEKSINATFLPNFEAISGLKINLAKLEIIHVGHIPLLYSLWLILWAAKLPISQ
jgi:hypothetical protein